MDEQTQPLREMRDLLRNQTVGATLEAKPEGQKLKKRKATKGASNGENK